jgi:hypothetical protein
VVSSSPSLANERFREPDVLAMEDWYMMVRREERNGRWWCKGKMARHVAINPKKKKKKECVTYVTPIALQM